MAQVVELVVAARRGGDRLAVEDAAHRADRFVEPVEPLAEAACRTRCRGRVCSGSIHAPPMPRMARPPLMWSSVAAVLATSPGLRNVLAPTSRPTRVRSVAIANAASERPALEDGLVRVAEDRVEVVPCPEVVVAEPVDEAGCLEQVGPGGGLVPEQDAGLEVGHGRAPPGGVVREAHSLRLGDGARRTPRQGIAARSASARPSATRRNERRENPMAGPSRETPCGEVRSPMTTS